MVDSEYVGILVARFRSTTEFHQVMAVYINICFALQILCMNQSYSICCIVTISALKIRRGQIAYSKLRNTLSICALDVLR